MFGIDDVSVLHFDIGDNTENLEFADACNFTIMWPKFYHMNTRSPRLRKL